MRAKAFFNRALRAWACRPRSIKEEKGQVLAIVIVLLLIVSTLVPVMVMYTQRESVWTAKQAHNTTAFHLAESGIEKGFLAVSQSTLTWVNLQDTGVPIEDYHFDREYTDISGGTYAISITSGPLEEQATIVSIGRDTKKREVRALKAVYTNSPLGGIAVYGGGGAQVDGGVEVEWGAVISPGTVNADSRLSPQFWSASGITTYDTNPEQPNCDPVDTTNNTACCQWHAYATNIPLNPIIDLTFYKSSATASTGCPTGGTPEGSCYYTGNVSWSSQDLIGKTVYIEGNLTLGSPGLDMKGNLIVMGNMSTTSGNFGKGTYNMPMPTDAWKQYCRNWDYYRSEWDGAASATFPGINASYTSNPAITQGSNKIAVWGLMYVGGSFSVGGGGGGTDMYGVMYVVGTATMTSSSAVTLWYNAEAAKSLQLTRLFLSRVSWQNTLNSWPSNLP